MCFGNKQAQIAQYQSNIDQVNAKNEAMNLKNEQLQKEQQRQADVTRGQADIESAFTRFSPEYYQNYQTQHINVNTPQVEDQYARAMDKATSALAGRGILKSSIAARAFGDIGKTRNTALGQVANDAVTAARQLQQAVEKQKTDLYSLNTASSDPAAITARAQGEAATLVAPPPARSQMGDLFASSLAPVLTNYIRADTYSPYGGRIASFLSPPTSGSGTGRVVS